MDDWYVIIYSWKQLLPKYPYQWFLSMNCWNKQDYKSMLRSSKHMELSWVRICSYWCLRIGIDWRSSHSTVPKLCMRQCNVNSRHQQAQMPVKLPMWTATPMEVEMNYTSISSPVMGPTMGVISLRISLILTLKDMGWLVLLTVIWRSPSPNHSKYTGLSSATTWACQGVGTAAILKACKFKYKRKAHSNGLRSIRLLACRMRQTQLTSPK